MVWFLMRNLRVLPVVFVGLMSFAHEGHDHDAPRTGQAPKGGVIKSLEETSVEVVSKGKDLKIYFYDKELKPRDVETYTVSAKAELPRTKKIENITLKPMGTFFEASFDAKGAHRYTLLLAVKDPKAANEDMLKFTIEPRK